MGIVGKVVSTTAKVVRGAVVHGVSSAWSVANIASGKKSSKKSSKKSK